MIQNAIQELRNWDINMPTYYINNFETADHTSIDGSTLYYKSVTEGLLALSSQQPLNKVVSNLGIMYDISRCAVLSVDSFKAEIRTLAVLGYDYLMIYAEDMFEIEVPNFGYMRGKYSAREIKEIVEYAEIFEIEVIPCIQSLGHYENFLKWDHEKIYTDTSSVLNVESSHVDELLNYLLKFCRDNFKSNTIHIGMDEANDLGRGFYLRDNNFQSQAYIYLKHLKNMYTKCLNLNYQQIIIWSDMLFTFDNLEGELYDNAINNEILMEIQKMNNLKLCYWNYWSKTPEQHIELINAHTKSFPVEKIICAGGINQWGQLNYLLDSKISFRSLLQAMTKTTCDDLLLTIWGDGAAYTNFYTSKFGIFERAFDVYQLENDKSLFKTLFKFSQEDIHTVSEFSLTVPNAPLYLWENPLELAITKCNPIDTDLFKSLIITEKVAPQLEYTKHLVNFTIYKALLANDLLDSKKSVKYLEPALLTYDLLYASFREYWLSLYKVHGMGIAQGRFSLLQNRLFEIEFRYNHNIGFPELEEYSDVTIKDLFNEIFYSTNLRS